MLAKKFSVKSKYLRSFFEISHTFLRVCLRRIFVRFSHHRLLRPVPTKEKSILKRKNNFTTNRAKWNLKGKQERLYGKKGERDRNKCKTLLLINRMEHYLSVGTIIRCRKSKTCRSEYIQTKQFFVANWRNKNEQMNRFAYQPCLWCDKIIITKNSHRPTNILEIPP